MNITNFKKQIPAEIYFRGVDYFENKNVSKLQNLNKGQWTAKVEGNYGNYTVKIFLDDQDNIKSYHCNCPYDGDICKHVVAVLLTIQDNKNKPITIEKQKEEIPEWQSILESISEKELRDFIFNYSSNNQDFQDELIISLSKAQKVINSEKYRNIITHNFNKMSDRYGYIEYGDVDSAMEPIDNLFEKAEDYLSDNKLHEAFSIASAISIECLNAIQNLDDSGGQCGGAICRSFDLLNDILDNCSDEILANTIFDWLHLQVQNKDYENYGCNDELESVFFNWANNPSRLEKAYLFIDHQINALEIEKNRNNEYRLTELLKYKGNLLTTNGEKEKADQIINDNLYLNDFKLLKINEALNQNDFKSAIEYIHQGILDEEKKNNPGTVINYKTQLLEIYTKQNDKKNVRNIAKDLYFNGRHSIEYYRIYKNTFSSNEWEKELEKIISYYTKQQKKFKWGYYFQSNLADVYIEEQMWSQLLFEVKQANHINTTEQYANFLKNNYSEDLILLYKNNILKYAEYTGREIYANIVNYLINMSKLKGGKEVAKDLMQELLDTYRNRPAMKDEFLVLKWLNN